MAEEIYIGDTYDPILGNGRVYVRHEVGADDWVAHFGIEWSFEYYVPLPPHNWGTNER